MQKTSFCRSVLFGRCVLKYNKKLSSTQIRIRVISHAKLSSFASSIKQEKFNQIEFHSEANINERQEVNFYSYRQADVDKGLDGNRSRVFMEHARKKMEYLLLLERQSIDPQSIFCKPLKVSLTQDESSLLPYGQRILNYVNNVEASDLTVDQCIKLLWLLGLVSTSGDSDIRAVKLVNSLCQQLNFLRRHEFVLLCYFMCFWRTMTTTIFTRVQNYLINHAAQFDVLDLTIVSYSMTKNRLHVDDDRVIDLFRSAACESLDLDDVKDTCFDSLLGRITHSKVVLPVSMNSLEPITRALNKMPIEKFASMSPFSITRYLEWVTKWEYLNDSFNERLKSCLHDGSLKFKRVQDISCLTYYLATMDYEDSDKYPTSSLFTKYLEVLRDLKDESTSRMPTILKSCALIGIFDEKFSDQVLAQDYVDTCHVARSLIFLDSSIAIEFPSYVGNRLTPESYNSLRKKLQHEKVPSFRRSRDFFEIICSVMNCDPSCVYIGKILPHFLRINRLLRIKDGKVLPAHAGFRTDIPVKVENYKAPDDETWICIMHRGKLLRGKTKINGFDACHQRQLLKLGYKIIEIETRNALDSNVDKTPHKDVSDLLHAIINESDGTKLTQFTFYY